jgi:hypothetical protein
MKGVVMRLFSFVVICFMLLTGCSPEENNAIVAKAKEPFIEENAKKATLRFLIEYLLAILQSKHLLSK